MTNPALQRSFPSGAACVAVVATTLCFQQPALAQRSVAAASTDVIEEVVITARRRAENLQEIEESITAFTAEDIENSRIESLRHVVDLTPNVIVRETFRSNETFITMRGISTAQGGLPAASFIVDGVQLGGNEFINQDLLDVERIEILRGPQGALFGQGAIAGAINVVTKAPSNETEGFLKASYGNQSSGRIAGSFSTPIVENSWYLRLAGYYADSNGLLENVRGENIDESDGASIRARLIHEGENLGLSLRGALTRESGGAAMQDRPVLGPDGNPVAPDAVDSPGPSSNIIGEEDTDFADVSLRIDYEFPFGTLTSITAYADAGQDVYGDADFGPVDVVIQDLEFGSEVFNQELRLASNADGRLRWLAGAFYQERDEVVDVFVAFSPNSPFNAGVTILHQQNATTSESYAVFGQLDVDITDRAELTVGLRYDEDDQTTVDRLNPGPTAASATFHKLQPKIQLSYHWSNSYMGYATYSAGFRSGGFTQNELFDDEETSNYELGFKGSFADGRFVLNASVFHVDYVNQQLSFVIFDEGVARRGVLNLSDTDINGLELEIAAKPLDSLQLNVGIGYVDSEIKAADTTALAALGITAPVTGNRSPLVPELTFNASATYRQPIGAGLNLVAHADYRRRGDYYFDPFNNIRTATRNFIQSSIRIESESWSVGVWGRNLGNARHATNISIGSSNRNRVQNQPRSYGIEASYRFGR